jgi:tetratricopeptide (TPR) repeat protein
MGWFSRKATTGKQVERTPPNVANLTADSLLHQAKASVEAGDTKSALAALDQAIALEPTNPEAYMRRGKLRRKLKDERGAGQDMSMAKLMIDRMDEGLKANDDGNAAYTSGDYRSAVRHFNKVISLLPTLTSVYYWRGLAKQYMDDFTGAIEDFNLCIAAHASNAPDAYYARGQIKYHKMNDSAGALQDYNRAIELKPEDPDVYRSRAILLDDHAAIHDLTRAIELNPTDPNTYLHRSLKRMSLQDYDAAIRDLTTVIDMAPDDLADMTFSEVFSLRGHVRLLLYDFPAALEDANKAIELDQTRAVAFLDRGTIKAIMKDTEGAVADLDTAISLDPSCAEAYHQRGLARRELGMESEAIADITKAKELGFTEE